MRGGINRSGLILRIYLVLGIAILYSVDSVKSQQPEGNKLPIDRISSEISAKSSAGDSTGLILLADRFKRQAEEFLPDSALKADLYYFSGVCYLLVNEYNKALSNLLNANHIKKSSESLTTDT